MAAREPSWVPARGWLIVQAVVVALMTLVAIVASVVQGAVVLPLTGLLGGLLPWRDLRRQRASRPAVGPRPTWAVDEGGTA